MENHENPPEVSYSTLKGGVWSDTSFNRRIFRMQRNPIRISCTRNALHFSVPKMLHPAPKGAGFCIFVHKKTILFFILFIFIIGCAKQIEKPAEMPVSEPTQETLPESQDTLPQPETQKPEPGQKIVEAQKPNEPSWKEGSIAIAGKYADADIVDLGNGNYRMYYSAEPEVQGFKGQVYSAVSSDGVNWEQENGLRKEWATFPSVIKTQDGKYRMYFQNQRVIKSAISNDGLSWKDESGTRADASNDIGLNFDGGVLAPTVISYNGEYVMVYAGAMNQKYPADTPNSDTHVLLWAASKDGIDFDKKGMALDSRNNEFLGFLDGPEFVIWDDGSLRLYFWGYKGIYHSTFHDGSFSEPVFDFTTPNDNPFAQFTPNPPGDPTLAKISGKWLMYYGQHTKGIYYAILED